MTDSKVSGFAPEKKSYTAKLIEKLETLGTQQSTLDAIKDFAIEQYDERKKQEADTAGTVTFGKYKGKKFEDIAKLDQRYLHWIFKNSKYLSATNKAIVEQIIEKLKA